MGAETGRRIDVSVRRRCNHRPPGVRAHTRLALRDEDVTERHDIPVTTPVRTLIDQATELTPKRLERAVNEADKRDLIDPEALRTALDAHAGQPEVRPLRALLDRQTFRLSDSELEVLFRSIAAKAGLPTTNPATFATCSLEPPPTYDPVDLRHT
jgi:hypothetical protein